MLSVLARVPFYTLFRRFDLPRMTPLNMTLSPSPRCNSRCLTCNIWKRREDELTLEDMP
jgi:MoaA/NifB/PqqE/SkfB family radical SAM enzyme